MKKEMKSNIEKVITGLVLIVLGAILALWYVHFSPTHTSISPSGYFPNPISIPQIDLSNLIIYRFSEADSMFPVFSINSQILLEPYKENMTLQVGDIITFNKNNITTNDFKTYTGKITHRIVGIKEMDGEIYYQTKGDNIKYKDVFLVSKNEIIGKVVAILY